MSDPWANQFPPQFDVGTPGGGHVHFGNDGSITMYGPDGVTVIGSWAPNTGLMVYEGSISTARGGIRWVISSNQSDSIFGYTGSGSESVPAALLVASVITGSGLVGELRLSSPDFGFGSSTIRLQSAISDGSLGSHVYVDDDTTVDGVINATISSLAPNLPKVSDGLVVPVVVAGGTSSGSANFTWPKGLFTATPIASGLIVSGSGNAIRATEFATSITAAGGTMRVDCNANIGSTTTFNVHTKGEQFV